MKMIFGLLPLLCNTILPLYQPIATLGGDWVNVELGPCNAIHHIDITIEVVLVVMQFVIKQVILEVTHRLEYGILENKGNRMLLVW
jgi:hypothetical protein